MIIPHFSFLEENQSIRPDFCVYDKNNPGEFISTVTIITIKARVSTDEILHNGRGVTLLDKINWVFGKTEKGGLITGWCMVQNCYDNIMSFIAIPLVYKEGFKVDIPEDLIIGMPEKLRILALKEELRILALKYESQNK